jgi:hypothetical protein
MMTPTLQTSEKSSYDNTNYEDLLDTVQTMYCKPLATEYLIMQVVNQDGSTVNTTRSSESTSFPLIYNYRNNPDQENQIRRVLGKQPVGTSS